MQKNGEFGCWLRGVLGGVLLFCACCLGIYRPILGLHWLFEVAEMAASVPFKLNRMAVANCLILRHSLGFGHDCRDRIGTDVN